MPGMIERPEKEISAEVKLYLRQIRDIESAVMRIEDQLATIRAERSGAKALAYDKDRIRSTATSDQMVNLLIKYDDTERELWEGRTELLKRRSRICQEIELLDNEKLRQVLYYVYVRHLSWDETASAMGYTRRRVEQLHGIALLELSKKIS